MERCQKMKAQIITQFGNPSVFTFTDIPKPTLKPGHVLIKVFATSVNPVDCKIRSGAVPGIAPEFPALLHGDVAGVIEEIASDVKNFKVGDEVFGCAGGLRGTPGALAEYMLADARLLAKKPKSLSMLETAALPLVSITAWEALFKKAHLTKDQNILIHGGAGGVGHVAIQLAKWCGSTVYTTVRKTEDISLTKSFGADVAINSSEEDTEDYVKRRTEGKGFDVIFDTIGGAHLDQCFAAAKLNGTIVTTVARSTNDLTPMHNKALSLHVVFMLLPLLTNIGRAEHGEILAKIADIVDMGKLKPMLDKRRFTLESIGEAHALLESGEARGKVVVRMS